MRITTVRIIVQIFFFSLFLFFCFVTEFSYLKGYPVSLFLEADPLVAVATAITTHTIYKGLIWSLVLLLPTLLLGRFFCNWICPYGILHQFVGWLFNKRDVQKRIDSNRYRAIYQTKYYILIFFGVMALLGSLQIGLLDPICLMFRSFTAAVLPAINMSTNWVYVEMKEHQGAWFVGLLIFGLVAANLVIPRFFCRVLCPLGAFLGTLSRFAIWRIDRDPHKCTDCDLCLKSCEGASDPHTLLRKSECFVCFNCIEDCPHDALSFKFMPREESGVQAPQITGRRAAFAAVTGLLLYPFTRLSGDTNNKTFNRAVIRPPGSVEEKEFLERCIKCDQCIRVCPTNVLQPAFFQSGLEGFWTPIMDMRLGYCELNCTLCGQVCPTGAIQRISIKEKLGMEEFEEQGPVKVGTAFYDRGRCLPWAMETPCVVCEEVCPVSPKAIDTYDEEITRADGTKVLLNKPYIIPERCIGCGICEKECPVLDQRAVYVTAVGETRFRNQSDRRLLLNDKDKKASLFQTSEDGKVSLNHSMLSSGGSGTAKHMTSQAAPESKKRLSLSQMILTIGATAAKSGGCSSGGCGSGSTAAKSGGCSSGGCGSGSTKAKSSGGCGSSATAAKSSGGCGSIATAAKSSGCSSGGCGCSTKPKTAAQDPALLPKSLPAPVKESLGHENINLVTWVRELNNRSNHRDRKGH